MPHLPSAAKNDTSNGPAMPGGIITREAPGLAERRQPDRGLRVLTFSTLFPNAEQPGHGVFVETRIRRLAADGGIHVRVVAPVPWFPVSASLFGRYAAYARVPRQETRHGLSVAHPRFVQIPKLGAAPAPWLLYRAALPLLRRLRADGFDFDLIDSHYLFPDGVAAVLLGRTLRRPVTLAARGSDVNVFPELAAPRRWILWALSEADGISSVCEALKTKMVAMGIAPERICVIRNGVDLEMFRPVDRATARRALGVAPPVLATVGNLIPLKAQDLIVRALPMLPGATLLIVGDGPAAPGLQALAADLGVADRVRFLGRLPQADLCTVYAAADVSVLASRSEGLANVLLESMACGTPVVASDVGGNAEAVESADAGRLLAERSPEAIAEAVAALLADPPDRAAVRAHAATFDWSETTRAQRAMFDAIVARRGTAP